MRANASDFVVGLGQAGVVGWHEVAASRASHAAPRVRALRAARRVVAEEAPVVGARSGRRARRAGSARGSPPTRRGTVRSRRPGRSTAISDCAQQEDAAQHQLGDALRVRLRVREREGGAPRAAEHHATARCRGGRAAARRRATRCHVVLCSQRRRAACSCRSRAGRTARCGRRRGRRSGAASARCRRPARRAARRPACRAGLPDSSPYTV